MADKDEFIRYLLKIKEELEESCNIKFDFSDEEFITYARAWLPANIEEYLEVVIDETEIVPDFLDFRNKKFVLYVTYFSWEHWITIDIKNKKICSVKARRKGMDIKPTDIGDFLLLSWVYIKYLENSSLKEKISDHLDELFE